MSNQYAPGFAGDFDRVSAEAKSLLKSRTVWMIGASIVAGILRAHGHVVADADMQGLVQDLLESVEYGAAGLAVGFRAMAKGPLK